MWEFFVDVGMANGKRKEGAPARAFARRPMLRESLTPFGRRVRKASYVAPSKMFRA